MTEEELTLSIAKEMSAIEEVRRGLMGETEWANEIRSNDGKHLTNGQRWRVVWSCAKLLNSTLKRGGRIRLEAWVE
jgi:hypothetical protein